jgi:HSP20 family protein
MAGTLAKRKVRSMEPWFRHGPFAPLREEFEDLYARLLGDDRQDLVSGDLTTYMDVAETEKAVEVRLDLPGFKAEDVDIQLNAGVLTVRGERTQEHEEEDKQANFHRMERRFGSFSRSVSLPCGVADDEATADFKNGVLSIMLPKSDEAKPRKIKVTK